MSITPLVKPIVQTFTPGPWFILPDPILQHLHPCHEARFIATAPLHATYEYETREGSKSWAFENQLDSIICTLPDAQNQKQNAALLVAAPKMVACLRIVLHNLEHDREDWPRLIAMVRKTLAEAGALGEEP